MSLLIDSKLLMPMNNKLCCRKLFDNSKEYNIYYVHLFDRL